MPENYLAIAWICLITACLTMVVYAVWEHWKSRSRLNSSLTEARAEIGSWQRSYDNLLSNYSDIAEELVESRQEVSRLRRQVDTFLKDFEQLEKDKIFLLRSKGVKVTLIVRPMSYDEQAMERTIKMPHPDGPLNAVQGSIHAGMVVTEVPIHEIAAVAKDLRHGQDIVVDELRQLLMKHAVIQHTRV